MNNSTTNSSLSAAEAEDVGRVMTDDSQLFHFFCRHLVALCITVNEQGAVQTGKQPRFKAYSGTLLRIGETTYFLTAGHILRDIDQEIKKARVDICQAILVDSFGPSPLSTHPIPFDLLNEPRFYIDDEVEGLDYGVIPLRQNYTRLLEANGIIAIAEENWRNQPEGDFDAYLMLGLPKELASDQISESGEAKVEPVIMSIQKVENPPKEVPVTRKPQFVGQIDNEPLLKSIDGMSGGPIFGVKFGPPACYWIVALQSAWLARRRVVVGCQLPLLARLLTEHMEHGLK
jgi:hypothetical protein